MVDVILSAAGAMAETGVTGDGRRHFFDDTGKRRWPQQSCAGGDGS